jgi:hypothetical protein
MSATTDKLLSDAVATLERVAEAEADAAKTSKIGIMSALGALKLTRGHAAKAMALGRDADALLLLAKRHLFEAALKLKIIASHAPPGDVNAAAIAAIILQLNS